MGRYRSDDSDDDDKKTKKKKKRRARSRSSSDSDTSHMSSNKSKKSKKKHRRSSRSRTPEKRRGPESRSARRTRSRSNSLDKYISKRGRSRSTSLDNYISRRPRSPERRSTRKSRSPPPRRARSRSRSHTSRRRRSRSNSRGHRSKSPVRRSKSPVRRRSYSRERRSRSHDRGNSRRSSAEGKRGRDSRESPNVNVKGLSLADQSTGFSSLTPSMQAEERMRLALKAAAAADEKLRIRETTASTPSDAQTFAHAVAAIESNSFVQSNFKTSRVAKVKDEAAETQANHDDAIFGSLTVSGFTIKPDLDNKPLQFDQESIIHPSLYIDPEEKMDKWISRLAQLRQKKLEGDAMH